MPFDIWETTKNHSISDLRHREMPMVLEVDIS